ncbi:MAG: alpha-D-ribose 1-methylphosphonate 5-triphosphate diphosphatase, partial [Mangrovicoccus sp.]|nr:alpha-D-ribose 1-methylphosphonate 5-triphosphate diphosphatase [Mangrovicoccus sp.]
IDYLVINDHLPHRHLTEGRKPPRLTGSALKAGRSPEAHLALMQRMAANAPEVDGFVKGLVRDLGATTRFGSHDDPDGQTRAHWQDMGLSIAEFPTSFAAAEAAKAQGSPVVMGAPNVVRGGSHNKSVSASDLLRAGLVDALASDYHYPAMVAAAFALSDQAVCSFAAAWALISARPAAVMGLEDRGEIAPGKRADFLVLDPGNRQVLGCFAAGRPVFLSGALADAVMG